MRRQARTHRDAFRRASGGLVGVRAPMPETEPPVVRPCCLHRGVSRRETYQLAELQVWACRVSAGVPEDGAAMQQNIHRGHAAS